jgi:glycosyltransferase involved in cell wall biosynthesis
MYAGTFGLASGVEILLDVAESVKERHRIRIVCIGDGVRRKELLAEKERRSLTNFLVLPFQPRERLSEVQSSADVMILTSSPDMGLSSIPSKFITYLAVGKPVICSIDAASDIGKTVTEQNLGRVVAPGNAKTLADAIVDLEQMEARLLVEMGERARQVALSRYSADSALKKIVGILSQAAQKQ